MRTYLYIFSQVNNVFECNLQKFIIMEYRIEKDTMGEVMVPVNAYYGAQTQRSIDNFKIAQDINKMPKEIIAAFAYLKHGSVNQLRCRYFN